MRPGARYGPEKMIAKAKANPMTPKAVFAFWDKVGVEMGTGVQYNSTYGTDNSYLLDVCKEYPNRAVPVVILSPNDAKTPTTLEKWTKENRLTAVRFSGTPNAQGAVPYLADDTKETWAAANDLGISVVLMALGNNIPPALKKIAEFADRYPNVKIAMDHIGFPRPENLPQTFGLSPEHIALAAHKNVYYKCTSFLVSEMEAGAKTANKPMVELKPFLRAHGQRLRRRPSLLGLGLRQRGSGRRGLREAHGRCRCRVVREGQVGLLLRHRQGGVRAGRSGQGARLILPP